MTRTQQARGRRPAGDDARERLLDGLPVAERRLPLAGVSTALLEGGSGPPLVLLHGPGAYGAAWHPVIPGLVTTHRVVAPDLPGQGASSLEAGAVDVERIVTWLGELIDSTCPSPPLLVGHLLGGAVAATFAAEHGDWLSRLVLVDTFGLSPLAPTPEFGAALMGFLTEPTAESHDGLWQHCSFDLDSVRRRLGERWDAMKDYTLDLATTPAVAESGRALMELFAMPAIPPEVLAGIAAPTTLIWGRHDLATPLRVAESAAARYGWPLHVIDAAADDPMIDQPEAFLHAFRSSIDGGGT